jgi:hypothetical protein
MSPEPSAHPPLRVPGEADELTQTQVIGQPYRQDTQTDVQQDHDTSLGPSGYSQHWRCQLGKWFSQHDEISIRVSLRFLLPGLPPLCPERSEGCT